MKQRLLVLFYSVVMSYISQGQQEPVFSFNETNQGLYNPSATAVNNE